ncbi:hypothetical protein EJ04DRAFT_521293 [Polyplosphaeria fusca]|uniref:Uncharacterized protein n=1 Tax=Polyplosphaeria fusca TaxID=682080 RepID=A0A9P4R399_9PLEO|nr:hypothetical protein EJ04DRAFT_521293 [Polyplosphaeria fusca]
MAPLAAPHSRPSCPPPSCQRCPAGPPLLLLLFLCSANRCVLPLPPLAAPPESARPSHPVPRAPRPVCNHQLSRPLAANDVRDSLKEAARDNDPRPLGKQSPPAPSPASAPAQRLVAATGTRRLSCPPRTTVARP